LIKHSSILSLLDSATNLHQKLSSFAMQMSAANFGSSVQHIDCIFLHSQ